MDIQPCRAVCPLACLRNARDWGADCIKDFHGHYLSKEQTMGFGGPARWIHQSVLNEQSSRSVSYRL